jgi:hypothetical protein
MRIDFSEIFWRTFCGIAFWDKHTRYSMRALFLNKGLIKGVRRIQEVKNQKESNQKFYLSVVATVRNEDIYLSEWIEYNLLMGVQHFYIYDNESSDNTKEVLKPYVEKGLVTYIYYPGEDKQIEIYNVALKNFGSDSTWLMYIDVDEFIKIKTGKKLIDYIKENEGYSQLIFQWVCFGSSNYKTKPEGLVIENFIKRQEGYDSTMKSIVKSSTVLLADVHKHSVLGKYKEVPYEEAQCNHYYCKSEEEFIKRKAARGRNGHPNEPYTSDEFNGLNKYANMCEEKMPDEILNTIKKNLAMFPNEN